VAHDEAGGLAPLPSPPLVQFTLLHKCFRCHFFQPVNCIFVSRVKSLWTTTGKQCWNIYYMMLSVSVNIHTFQRTSGQTCVDLHHVSRCWFLRGMTSGWHCCGKSVTLHVGSSKLWNVGLHVKRHLLLIVHTVSKENVLLCYTAREQRRRSGRRSSKDRNIPSDTSLEHALDKVVLNCFVGRTTFILETVYAPLV